MKVENITVENIKEALEKVIESNSRLDLSPSNIEGTELLGIILLNSKSYKDLNVLHYKMNEVADKFIADYLTDDQSAKIGIERVFIDNINNDEFIKIRITYQVI